MSLTKKLLLIYVGQLQGDKDHISKYDVLRELGLDFPEGPRRELAKHRYDLLLDELYDEGKIQYLAGRLIKVVPEG